jgi:hypothetical protein
MAFSMLLAGSGDAGTPPSIGKLLKGCYLDESLSGSPADTVIYRYTGIADATPVSITAAVGGGLLIVCADALGNASFDFQPGQPVKVNFTFVGTYVEPSEGSISTAIAYDANPPACIDLGATIGTAIILESAGIDLNNENAMHKDMNSASGYSDPVATNQIPTYKARTPVVSPLLGNNYPKEFTDGTKGSFAMTLGSKAGNTIDIAMDGYQADNPKFVDDNGVYHVDLMYEMSTEDDDTPLTIMIT